MGEMVAHRTTLRRCAAEPAVFLGGQRALLLQIAHPLVAGGVEHHSSFRTEPVRRLWSTIDALMCLVWGRPDEARAARDGILGIHDGVHGEIDGLAYDAHDPELLWWVWATLVDTVEVVHARFLRPLDDAVAEHLYLDWCDLARFMGIPDALLDGDRRSFTRRYLAARDRLAPSPTGIGLAGAILDPPVPAPRALIDGYALIAAGLLDERTRAAYGLAWDAERQAAYAQAELQIRAAWAQVPGWRRRVPDAWLAGRRTVLALTSPFWSR